MSCKNMKKNKIKNLEELRKIEELEKKYLDKYYFFLKFAEDELLLGFKTKFKIKNDWIHKWNPSEEGKGISDFATGAERIVYSLLNGKGIGQPNSSPIGADLFFEVDDAFIHIDLKTVQTRNIGDYNTDIFVGNNQNSYNGNLTVSGLTSIYEEASLPHYYTLDTGIRKPCLTYFITILYEEHNLDILNINLLCMPNGILYPVYGESVLKAGKVKFKKGDKRRDTHSRSVRYRWNKCQNFKLLKDSDKRIKIAYFNSQMDEKFKSKLHVIENIYNQQFE